MASLIAGALDGLSRLTGLAGDNTPYVPSAPVEIGTSKPHHGVPEVGSWQGLIVMFGLVLVVGAAVLMYAVRQRTRLLERRRVRRMADAVALMGDAEASPTSFQLSPPPTTPTRTSRATTRHAEPPSSERVP